ncbi:hypothetical protein [Shewanella fidelis]|uniref:Uncharacterized protein n=1 Tax=Shewanella fidelis TaxID=173509 RepID=A0AAW8NM78_9GAMM|nr:hypothetical protein [Shewanella fidelis]MDR8524318.1 hypothetical protein [Shewanella fidelis]MDW4813473.1 hypothetical protein [Shewanella fidelis]MDW4817604.1 hypothetical protein [Shewanella fidelis]MDW4821671.1 hypothetical protein [Shewanella fidelis]MDW4825836.1 hypothetical protein [Shewanella fidelis]
MKISSFSLMLASGQSQSFGSLTSQTRLKQVLKQALELAETDTLPTHEQASNAAATANPTAVENSTVKPEAKAMPMLIVQAKSGYAEFTFTFDLLTKEEGLLTLFYSGSKAAKERQKQFGFVTIDELQLHLQRLLTMNKAQLIDFYFAKHTLVQRIVKYTLLSYVVAAVSGLLSYVYFSDLLWRDDVFSSFYTATIIIYLVSLPVFICHAMSADNRERAQQMGQSLAKQMLALMFGNVIFSLAIAAGGVNLMHVVQAQTTTIEIKFADKNRDYWGKHCKGGVRIDDFSGTICLQDRAYWQVIRPEMTASATGQLSNVAFDVKAMAL